MQHNTASKNDAEICNRLRRIEGQIRGIIRMLEEHRSCEDIITQVLAARSAMDKAAAEILSRHVDECLGQMPPSEARTMISRAVQLINKIS
jgi:DNA-binding FrmR family transcriptional regulator